jgi:hypothetical protein
MEKIMIIKIIMAKPTKSLKYLWKKTMTRLIMVQLTTFK